MEPSWQGFRAGTGPTPARNRANILSGCASLAEGGQDFFWRKNSDAGEAAKVLGIERQQIRNSVHAHRCHHTSVMDLDTGDARCNYDFPPLLMCCFAVGGKREFGFNQSSAFIRLCNGESEPVPISRSSTHVPEFSQILRCIKEVRFLCPKAIRTLPNRSIFGTVGLYEAEKDICVHQVGRTGHQACSP